MGLQAHQSFHQLSSLVDLIHKTSRPTNTMYKKAIATAAIPMASSIILDQIDCD